MKKNERIEIAEMIANKFNGKVWIKETEEKEIKVLRVYIGKGYCEVNDNGVNIDSVNRNQFTDVKDFCVNNNINVYRA